MSGFLGLRASVGIEGMFGVMETFLNFIAMMFVQLEKFTRTH